MKLNKSGLKLVWPPSPGNLRYNEYHGTFQALKPFLLPEGQGAALFKIVWTEHLKYVLTKDNTFNTLKVLTIIF